MSTVEEEQILCLFISNTKRIVIRLVFEQHARIIQTCFDWCIITNKIWHCRCRTPGGKQEKYLMRSWGWRVTRLKANCLKDGIERRKLYSLQFHWAYCLGFKNSHLLKDHAQGTKATAQTLFRGAPPSMHIKAIRSHNPWDGKPNHRRDSDSQASEFEPLGLGKTHWANPQMIYGNLVKLKGSEGYSEYVKYVRDSSFAWPTPPWQDDHFFKTKWLLTIRTFPVADIQRGSSHRSGAQF